MILTQHAAAFAEFADSYRLLCAPRPGNLSTKPAESCSHMTQEIVSLVFSKQLQTEIADPCCLLGSAPLALRYSRAWLR